MSGYKIRYKALDKAAIKWIDDYPSHMNAVKHHEPDVQKVASFIQRQYPNAKDITIQRIISNSFNTYDLQITINIEFGTVLTTYFYNIRILPKKSITIKLLYRPVEGNPTQSLTKEELDFFTKEGYRVAADIKRTTRVENTNYDEFMKLTSKVIQWLEINNYIHTKQMLTPLYTREFYTSKVDAAESRIEFNCYRKHITVESHYALPSSLLKILDVSGIYRLTKYHQDLNEQSLEDWFGEV